MLTELRWN